MEKFELIKGTSLHFKKARNLHPAETYFHFSFADYIDRNKMNFGVLRVLNDDRVKPHSGFGTHPHNNMEIFSYLVSGKLSHRDSVGNFEILERGNVQYISAGTGVSHSELNEEDEWCRFLQIWILPPKRGLPVKYGIEKFKIKDRKNRLFHIISGSNSKEKAPIQLFQDVNVFVTELTDKNTKINYVIEENRQAYLYCFEGSLCIDGFPKLEERDSLKIYGESKLSVMLNSEISHFILIEMSK